MKHSDVLAALGTSGAVDVSSLIAMAPSDVGTGNGTQRTPDDQVARKAGRGF